MKLKDCLEIGLDCGLETVGEAVYNIKLHQANLFTYDTICTELEELACEYVVYEVDDKTSICDALNHIKTSETHRAIIENFNPDDAETDRVLQEATKRTIEKYREE